MHLRIRVWRQQRQEPVRSVRAVPVREAALAQWLQAFEPQVQAVRPGPGPPSAPAVEALAAVGPAAAPGQPCRPRRWIERPLETAGPAASAQLQNSTRTS